MTTKQPRLLLVYNADRGIINALKDAVWKMTSPATYPCSLCAITYGAVSMRAEWRRFLKGLPLEVAFHHKDDFALAYPDHGIALPVIAIDDRQSPLRVLIPNTELDAMRDTSALMGRVIERLADERLLAVPSGVVA